MNLRVYTLTVSLVVTIGLLLSVAPALRSVLEYRTVDMPAELASADTFFLAKGREQNERAEWLSQVTKIQAELRGGPDWRWRNQSEQKWQAMYSDAKGQYIQTARSKAFRGLATYGALCLLCIGLLITHLRWARRLAKAD